MSRKLSDIDGDEDDLWFIGHEQKTLARELAGRRNPGVLWQSHFALACRLYQQEEASQQVRAHFVAAATNGLAAYERRAKQEPDETSYEVRTPWDFGLMLGTVAAFGSSEERVRAGRLERWKWLSPENEFFALLAASIEQFQSFLAGTFDVVEAERVAIRCRAPTADRDDRRFNRFLVVALWALNGGDAASVTAAVNRMVAEHEYRARHGFLRALSDGLVAVVPLGLVRLARLHGMDLAISSPYVPVELLESDATRHQFRPAERSLMPQEQGAECDERVAWSNGAGDFYRRERKVRSVDAHAAK